LQKLPKIVTIALSLGQARQNYYLKTYELVPAPEEAVQVVPGQDRLRCRGKLDQSHVRLVVKNLKLTESLNT
jgi:hypothetical protein